MRVVVGAWGCVAWGLMGYRSRRERGIVRYSTESRREKERYGHCFLFWWELDGELSWRVK